MTPADFIHELLESNVPLFRLICDFNGSPNAEALPGWFAPKFNEKLLEYPRSRQKLLHLAFEEKNPNKTEAFYDFRNPCLRLALIDAPTLRTLTLWSGSAFMARTIAKVIDKSSHDALQALLGEAGFTWALRRASLLATLRPALTVATELPICDAVWQAGQQCLQACLGGLPDAFSQRLLVKLPSERSWDLSARVPSELRDQAWRFVSRVFLKELTTPWQPCFE